jgi:hypothetical protein
MSPRTAAELRAEAKKLIAPSLQRYPVPPAALSVIVDAVAFDLGAADDQALLAEDPTANVETHARREKRDVSTSTPSTDLQRPTCSRCALPMRLTSEGPRHVCYTCDVCKTSGAYSVNHARHPHPSRRQI